MENQMQTIQVIQKKGNGLGTAGFVLALIGLILCWVPILGAVLLFLGFIFSLIGLIVGISAKRPIGLSIAGLVISLIIVIITIVLLGGLVGGLVALSESSLSTLSAHPSLVFDYPAVFFA